MIIIITIDKVHTAQGERSLSSTELGQVRQYNALSSVQRAKAVHAHIQLHPPTSHQRSGSGSDRIDGVMCFIWGGRQIVDNIKKWLYSAHRLIDLSRIESNWIDTLLTRLSARVVEGGCRLDSHRGDSSITDLSAWITPASGPWHLFWLGRLATEVATSHHLLRSRLAPKSASDKDILGCRRLTSDDHVIVHCVSRSKKTFVNTLNTFFCHLLLLLNWNNGRICCFLCTGVGGVSTRRLHRVRQWIFDQVWKILNYDYSSLFSCSSHHPLRYRNGTQRKPHVDRFQSFSSILSFSFHDLMKWLCFCPFSNNSAAVRAAIKIIKNR